MTRPLALIATVLAAAAPCHAADAPLASAVQEAIAGVRNTNAAGSGARARGHRCRPDRSGHVGPWVAKRTGVVERHEGQPLLGPVGERAR